MPLQSLKRHTRSEDLAAVEKAMEALNAYGRQLHRTSTMPSKLQVIPNSRVVSPNRKPPGPKAMMARLPTLTLKR